jgi:uncharacterized Zn finger protein
MSATTETKARRLIDAGNVTITSKDGDRVEATVTGDHHTYAVEHDPVGFHWRCTCASRRECSHILAVTLVTVPRV